MWQRDIIDGIIIIKIILYLPQFAVFIIILQPDIYFQFYKHLIWPSNAASSDLGNQKWNWILVVVATLLELFSFYLILILPKLTELQPSECQGHLVSMWPWPLTCDFVYWDLLQACVTWKDDYYIRIDGRDIALPKLAPGANLSKHEYTGQHSGHPVTSSRWKIFFLA